MARLYLTFKDNELTAAIDGIATTDTIGLEGVAEFFGWDGYSRTIVFYQNPRKPYCVVCPLDEFTFAVPHEVLTTDGQLTIGAFGVTEDGKRKTSTVAIVNITKGMFDEKAIKSIKPTPTEYEQMLAFMNAYMEAEHLVDSVAEAAEQATEIAKEAITVEKNVAIEEAKAEISNASKAEKAEIETLSEEIIERAEGYADAAELSSIEAANSVGRISSVEKRLSNIEQSITPSPFVVDDTVAYAKAVPVNALPYAEVNEIGGATHKSKNLFKPFSTTPTTYSGITMQYLEDEDCFVFNGTLASGEVTFIAPYTFPLHANTTYYLKCWYVSGTADNFRFNVAFLGKIVDGVRSNFFHANTANGSNGSSGSLEISCTGQTWFYFNANSGGATFTNYKVKVCLKEGEPISAYEPYFEGLRSAPVTEVKSIGGNEVASLIIPDAVRNLKGYGEGNPNNPAECNKIDFERKTYHHVGDIVDGVWVPLASPETIDITDKLPLDNYIEVFVGGVVYAENEHKLDVPNKITYQIKEVT